MSKSIWLIVLLFFACNFTFSQDVKSVIVADTVYDNHRPSLMVHYYPLSHLHYFRPSIKLGFEAKLSEKLGLNVTLGYINEDFYLLGNTDNLLAEYRIKDLEGYYASIEPKYYPFGQTKGKKSSTFISLLLDMHDQEEMREERVLRYGGAYQQFMKYQRTEQSYTQMINWGTSLAKWEFINFDFSAGIGHRFIKIDNNLPVDAEDADPNNVSRAERISGNLSRLAIKLSLYLTFPAMENGHIPN